MADKKVDRYDIYNGITELLDKAVSTLDHDDVEWLIEGLEGDLNELQED